MRNFPEYKDAYKLHPEVQRRADLYRDLLGVSTTITSGYDESGHATNSEHGSKDKDGLPCSEAVDMTSKCSLLWQFCCAVMAGFTNIGIYPAWNGIHAGIRQSDIEKKWIGLGSGSGQQYLSFNESNVKKYLK